MSWLFSRALVEAFSEDTCLDGAPSALSSGSPTPQAYLPPDRMTAFSRPSRFGMTFSPLTADRGEALLTSYLEAFRARTSASQAREPASMVPAVECGDTWRGSLARFDPATSSWRTAQRSLLGDSDESSVIWPRSGMTAAGQCWELPTLERRTSGTGSGLSVPTPRAQESYQGDEACTAFAMAGFKQPKERAGKTRGSSTFDTTLTTAVIAMSRWPMPMSADARGSSGRPALGKQIQLVDAVRRLATAPVPRCRRGKASQATHDKNSRPLSEQIGGSLNPMWVEWLMGWPLGWTDLKPLATGKSPCALQQHGTS